MFKNIKELHRVYVLFLILYRYNFLILYRYDFLILYRYDFYYIDTIFNIIQT
jgi:hypothetical protein